MSPQRLNLAPLFAAAALGNLHEAQRLQYRQLFVAEALSAILGRGALVIGKGLLNIHKRAPAGLYADVILRLYFKALQVFDFFFERRNLFHRRKMALLEFGSLFAGGHGQIQHLTGCKAQLFRIIGIARLLGDFIKGFDRTDRGKAGRNFHRHVDAPSLVSSQHPTEAESGGALKASPDDAGSSASSARTLAMVDAGQRSESILQSLSENGRRDEEPGAKLGNDAAASQPRSDNRGS